MILADLLLAVLLVAVVDLLNKPPYRHRQAVTHAVIGANTFLSLSSDQCERHRKRDETSAAWDDSNQGQCQPKGQSSKFKL